MAAESKGVWASKDVFGEASCDEKSDGDDDQEAINADDNENEEDGSDVSEAEAKDVKRTKAQREAYEKLELQKAMMPKKHKRLYHKIEHSEKVKSDAVAALESKRRVVEERVAAKLKKVKKV